MTDIDAMLSCTADPESAQRRFDDLLSDKKFQDNLNKLAPDQLQGLLLILGYSDFLSNYIRRHPDSLLYIGKGQGARQNTEGNAEDLRLYKYSELLNLTFRDLMNAGPYENILHDTSLLAAEILLKSQAVLAQDIDHAKEACILGMGKLGAGELNYSSDIDLIFVCDEPDRNADEYTETLIRNIRRFSRLMEEVTSEGFLYRVDLKLRPWGRSGPLVLSIDDTENYYSASTEAWERFIWLRARAIAGNTALGNELLRRLDPFVYRKFLSDDDLSRFLEIKAEMQSHHRKAGNWNVKQGKGGIRDIEFFIQLLQIVNAQDHVELKVTNTLEVLAVLVDKGFIQEPDAEQIRDSYLFLRRLENHLQMIDERQAHQLPDDKSSRKIIARSMLPDTPPDEALGTFEEQLGLHQAVARNCFERILPAQHMVQ